MKLINLVIIVVFLSSCSSTIKQYRGETRSYKEIASVIASENSPGEVLFASVIQIINGKDVYTNNDNGNILPHSSEIQILPGHYQLIINCKPTSNTTASRVMELDVEAGKTYHMYCEKIKDDFGRDMAKIYMERVTETKP